MSSKDTFDAKTRKAMLEDIDAQCSLAKLSINVTVIDVNTIPNYQQHGLAYRVSDTDFRNYLAFMRWARELEHRTALRIAKANIARACTLWTYHTFDAAHDYAHDAPTPACFEHKPGSGDFFLGFSCTPSKTTLY